MELPELFGDCKKSHGRDARPHWSGAILVRFVTFLASPRDVFRDSNVRARRTSPRSRLRNIAFFNGIVASAAGTPLAQAKGTEVERSQQVDSTQQREFVSQLKAEAAAGVGELDNEEHKPEERDADGRRLWERIAKKNSLGEPEGDSTPPKQVRDLSGDCGNQLDLSG